MRRTYSVAAKIAYDFCKMFLKNSSNWQIAGSIRRMENTIGDVDIITSEPLLSVTKRIEEFSHRRLIHKINGGDKKMDVDYKNMRFNIYYATPKYWGAMLFFLTGPVGYSIAYRRMAKERGWKLDQYGLHDRKGKVIAASSEYEIYKAFGKSYKEPERRGK